MTNLESRVATEDDGNTVGVSIAPRPGPALALARALEFISSGIPTPAVIIVSALFLALGLVISFSSEWHLEWLDSGELGLLDQLALACYAFGAVMAPVIYWSWRRASSVELRYERDAQRLVVRRCGRVRVTFDDCVDAWRCWPVVARELMNPQSWKLNLPGDRPASALPAGAVEEVVRDRPVVSMLLAFAALFTARRVLAPGLTAGEATLALAAFGPQPLVRTADTTLLRLERTLADAPAPSWSLAVSGGVARIVPRPWFPRFSRLVERWWPSVGLACDGEKVGSLIRGGGRQWWTDFYLFNLIKNLRPARVNESAGIDERRPDRGASATLVFNHLEHEIRLSSGIALRPWEPELILFLLCRESPALGERLTDPVLGEAARLAAMRRVGPVSGHPMLSHQGQSS